MHNNGQVMLTLRERLITPPVLGDPCLYDYISRIRQCYYVFLYQEERIDVFWNNLCTSAQYMFMHMLLCFGVGVLNHFGVGVLKPVKTIL